MAFSYSFHLSAKSHAISTVGKVGQCSRHNLREYKSARYDRSQIEILAGSGTSILDDVKQIYEDEFDECLRQYNQGKRSDRQIKNYLEHVSNSRSDVAAEIIIQVGDMDFWSDKTMEQKKQMSYIFSDQLRSLQKLCPEFKVASAVIHYDESSPHMHVVGVPIATGYKRGMEKQVAKTKVFTADRLSYLQDRMRENAEKGMKLNAELFQGKQLKKKEKGRNKDLPKESLTEFYNLQKNIESGHARKNEIEAELEELEDVKAITLDTLSDAQNELETARRTASEELGEYKKLKVDVDEVDSVGRSLVPGHVTVKQSDFLHLQKQAKSYVVNRNEIQSLRRRSEELEEKELELFSREIAIGKKSDEVFYLYERQLNLNQLLEKAEKERNQYRAKNDALERENASLREEIEKIKESFAEQIETLKKSIKTAYEVILQIVQAIGMFKYDEDRVYTVKNLNPKQDRLIDRICEFACEYARKAGFNKIADKMEQYVDISLELTDEVDLVNIEREKQEDKLTSGSKENQYEAEKQS